MKTFHLEYDERLMTSIVPAELLCRQRGSTALWVSPGPPGVEAERGARPWLGGRHESNQTGIHRAF